MSNLILILTNILNILNIDLNNLNFKFGQNKEYFLNFYQIQTPSF